MRRIELVLLALAALGCDDPDVASKTTAILLHGSVAAQAACTVTADNDLGSDAIFNFQATRFVDGSALVIGGSATVGNSRFFERNSADLTALTLPLRISFSNNNRIELSFDSGNVVVYEPTASPSDTPDTCAVETCCTGFNLEAFE